MGADPPAASLPFSRLVGVGAVIFFANAALLVLQLVASRLLAPFIGSDLYTWTSIIGVFLAGIALGNAYGGKLADRYPSPRTLAAVLLVGAVAAVWMAFAPSQFHGFYRSIPLGPRIPILSVLLCLPAGFVLSLLTPLAIKLGLPDVSRTGRVAGTIFALSTLGCLLGNYVTGFYLVPLFTVNALVYCSAGALAFLAVASFVLLKPSERESAPQLDPPPAPPNPHAFRSLRHAFAVVFVASFCGMTLELTASRLIAEKLGVSLFTWTGIIGVMLTGTALGNFAGGLLADRVNRPGSPVSPRTGLAATFVFAGGSTILVLATLGLLTRFEIFEETTGLVTRILAWTFALFFAPMFALGMISPQVIRLVVPDAAHAGRIAGRVYAWSTAGAILGTFAAGYVLISFFTMQGTLIVVTFALVLTSLGIAPLWRQNLMLYALAIVLGGATGGAILIGSRTLDPEVLMVEESNYYQIKITIGDRVELVDGQYTRVGTLHHLVLDHLRHSSVDLEDPKFIHYTHEHVQMEFLRAARHGTPAPKCLVIGGGGYTFPRFAKTVFPEMDLDVVEIDPAVTRVAYTHLGLKKEYGIRDFNMDGRQFVAEKATPGSYDLVIQDAVNDLSVPSHLLTKEYNDAVKAALKPDGVFLLTIIDEIEAGKLWRAATATLRQSFPHVALLTDRVKDVNELPQARHVYVIYASSKPLDLSRLQEHAAATPGTAPASTFHSQVVPHELLAPYLEREAGVVLTDQFAPVDNLMAEVFRRRSN
jgi:spermidine synthase/MFS family permease